MTVKALSCIVAVLRAGCAARFAIISLAGILVHWQTGSHITRSLEKDSRR